MCHLDLVRSFGGRVMRTWGQLAFIASSAAIIAASPAGAQDQQQLVDRCVNSAGSYTPDGMIDACMWVVNSGKWSGKNMAWAYNNLGKAYYLKQDFKAALTKYNQAIELDPNDSYAYCGRGMTKTQLGDHAGGDADTAQARKLDPHQCSSIQ